MSIEQVPMTREGFEKLRADLDRMQNGEMIEVAKRIAAARDLGDLSENAEYHAAREDQGMLQARIDALKDKLARAKIIDPNDLDKNAVVFGVANKRSIAWGIAQALSAAGAKLAITYMNERMKAEAAARLAALPPLAATKRSLPMSAPVSRDIPMMSGGGKMSQATQVTLSQAEREIAWNSFGPIKDKAGNLVDLTREEKERLFASNKKRMLEMRRNGTLNE